MTREERIQVAAVLASQVLAHLDLSNMDLDLDRPVDPFLPATRFMQALESLVALDDGIEEVLSRSASDYKGA